MLKVGDTVKVIGTTNCGGFEKECIPIGTICDVVATDTGDDGSVCYALVPKYSIRDFEYWYLEKDLEKGHLEWVKEE